MNTRQRFLLAAGLVALSGAVSVAAAPALPERMVSHWNAAGEPDATMAKGSVLALLPAVSAALVGLFAILPRIDPLGENVAEWLRAAGFGDLGRTAISRVGPGNTLVQAMKVEQG